MNDRRIGILAGLILIAGLALPALARQEACVVDSESSFRIFVGKSGLFRIFGHDHVIEAREIDACASIDPSGRGGSVTLRIPTVSLEVVDPGGNEQERADVQRTMQEEVLEIGQYQEVLFRSVGVEQGEEPGSLRVMGDLSIHGVTQPATIPVTLARQDDGSYRVTGDYEFKQSAFGIKTVRLFGGTISVRDEVRVEFDLSLRAPR